jgi:hypothetical protein
MKYFAVVVVLMVLLLGYLVINPESVKAIGGNITISDQQRDQAFETMDRNADKLLATLQAADAEKVSKGQTVYLSGSQLTPERREIAREWLLASDKIRPLFPEALKNAEKAPDKISSIQILGPNPMMRADIEISQGIWNQDWVVRPVGNEKQMQKWLARQEFLEGKLFQSLTPEQVRLARRVNKAPLSDREGGMLYNSLTTEQKVWAQEFESLTSQLSTFTNRYAPPGDPQKIRIKMFDISGHPQGMICFERGGILVGLETIEPQNAAQMEKRKYEVLKELLGSLTTEQSGKLVAGLPFTDLNDDQQTLFIEACKIKLILSGEGLSHLDKDRQSWNIQTSTKPEQGQGYIIMLGSVGEFVPESKLK